MAEKDNWDKFDILFKAIVLGIIPIVIGFAADNVAQSIQRGQLVQSLISDLTQKDAKRDVALIALNAAISKHKKCDILWLFKCQVDPENDQVVQIALALINNSIDDALTKGAPPAELYMAKTIITDRAGVNFYRRTVGKRYLELASNAQRNVISDVKGSSISKSEKETKANTSRTLAAIQPSATATPDVNLLGVRLVYIQYGDNKHLAEEIQQDIQNEGVSAPGTELIQGIEENDIRYANAADRPIAEKLKAYLEENHQLKIDKMIDLSEADYTVPPGQFEIWIK